MFEKLKELLFGKRIEVPAAKAVVNDQITDAVTQAPHLEVVASTKAERPKAPRVPRVAKTSKPKVAKAEPAAKKPRGPKKK